MKTLNEFDRLGNENKELETKENSIVKEMNLIKTQLVASNRRT